MGGFYLQNKTRKEKKNENNNLIMPYNYKVCRAPNATQYYMLFLSPGLKWTKKESIIVIIIIIKIKYENEECKKE